MTAAVGRPRRTLAGRPGQTCEPVCGFRPSWTRTSRWVASVATARSRTPPSLPCRSVPATDLNLVSDAGWPGEDGAARRRPQAERRPSAAKRRSSLEVATKLVESTDLSGSLPYLQRSEGCTHTQPRTRRRIRMLGALSGAGGDAPVRLGSFCAWMVVVISPWVVSDHRTATASAALCKRSRPPVRTREESRWSR